MPHHGGFPGSAMVTQLFRQFTKPLSERIVAYAARHPDFRRRLLIIPGRVYHRMQFSLEQLKNANKTVGFKRELVEIKDEEAVEIGSQLMIEVVIFAILVFLMSCDWYRSQLRAIEVEERRQRDFEELAQRKAEARERLEALEHETERVRQLIRQLQSEQIEDDAAFVRQDSRNY